MSSVASAIETPPQIDDVPYDLTADTFFAMIEADLFPEEARVYLEDGRLFEKMEKSDRHSLLGSVFMTILVRRLPPGWAVFPGCQCKLDPTNGPLTDIAVIRGDPRVYLAQDRRPDARDIGLVVEIAASSLAKDLGPNLERYARNGVPNYWVADVPGARLLVHSGPRVVDGRGEYDEVQVVVPGGEFSFKLDGREAGRFRYEDFMFRAVPPLEPGR